MECRLCLDKTADKCIFDSYLNIPERLFFYCKLQVCKNDGLPEHVCCNCIEKLNCVEQFVNKCKHSDTFLRANIQQYDIRDIKIEDANLGNVTLKMEPIDQKVEQFDACHEKETLWNDRHFSTDSDVSCDSVVFPKRSLKKKRNKKYEKENGKEVKEKKIGKLCPICGVIIPKTVTYSYHIKTHGEKTVSCEKCSKLFHSYHNLKIHLKTHRDIKKHKCEYCGKSFKMKSQCKRHIKNIHNRSTSYNCESCSRIFYNQQILKKHMLTQHTQEKHYQCEVCERAFSLKFSLKLHMRVHTGQRPYACTYCTSAFTTAKSLQEHVRLHTGETPYACPICKKGFAQRGNMRSHFKYNHKGMVFKKGDDPCG